MKALFRGFCRNENGKEMIYLNGEAVKGEWAYGYYMKQCENNIIVNTNSGVLGFGKKVIPETVCEAVRGLTDKNGQQVFEGDIVKHYNDKQFPQGYSKGVIFYDEENFVWKRASEIIDYCLGNHCIYEVIGTKWDKGE